MVRVYSSAINSVSYDESSKILKIEFYTGRVYYYQNVPKSIYESLVSAYSAGSFYNDHIKGVYASTEVSPLSYFNTDRNEDNSDTFDIESVKYDEISEILEIKFSNGEICHYCDVPESVYRDLLLAESMESFYRKHIKDAYYEGVDKADYDSGNYDSPDMEEFLESKFLNPDIDEDYDPREDEHQLETYNQESALLEVDFWQRATVGDVVKILNQGAGINVRDKKLGVTPLHVAVAWSEMPEVVNLLLDRGADIEARAKNGGTPLHGSARYGKTPEVAELLLNRGADIEARDRRGQTPLHWAAGNSETPEVVAVLLDRGAGMEARAKDGSTPLYLAVLHNKTPEVLALLLDGGAYIGSLAENGVTPLHGAAGYSETTDVVALLLDRGADIEARDEHGQTPLHWAAADSITPEVVSLLLDRGADIESHDNIRLTPLHVAATNSETPEVVAVLLDNDADIEARDEHGQTPLHWAVRYSKTLEVVALLLNRGANIKVSDHHGYTPLHVVARYSRMPTMIALLMNRDKDIIHVCDGFKKTPLHLAAAYSTAPAIVKALLDRGAEINVQDKNGLTPYDYAEENEHLRADGVIKLLEVSQSQLSLHHSNDITDETESEQWSERPPERPQSYGPLRSEEDTLRDFQKKQSESVVSSNLPAEFGQMKEYTTKRSTSSFPTTKDFTRPVLRWASGQPEEFSRQEVVDAVVDIFDLSTEAKKEQTVGGVIRLHSNVNWAISHLKHAELLRQTDNGNYEITDAGRKEAFSSNEVMNIKYLTDKFPAYRAGREEPL